MVILQGLVLLWLTGFVFSSLVLFPFIVLFWVFRLETLQNALVRLMSVIWPGVIFASLGTRLRVEGLDRIPKARKDLCFVGNHQAYFDILLIMLKVPRVVGFVGKKELIWALPVNVWMWAMHSLFLDRKNLRKAMATFAKGTKNLQSGRAQLIFPEGTRAKSSTMASFKKGSLKLATNAGAMIVPFSLNNTYKCLEEKGLRFGQTVYLKIHDPIDTSALSKEEKDALPARVESIVRQGLKDLLVLEGRDPALAGGV